MAVIGAPVTTALQKRLSPINKRIDHACLDAEPGNRSRNPFTLFSPSLLRRYATHDVLQRCTSTATGTLRNNAPQPCGALCVGEILIIFPADLESSCAI